MINSSTISGPRNKRTSSNDTRAVHPYVVNERVNMLLSGDNTPWTTSKITRNKDGSITIKIFTK